MNPNRYFSSDPAQRQVAAALYETVRSLPLVCPHGHVDPRLFSNPDYSFGTPVDLLIIPDHYIFRMLHSQGIPMEQIGVPRLDGGAVESDHRKIWQMFADNFYLFRGTPTGIWLKDELSSVFGVQERITGQSAQRIYDQIADKLAQPEFKPRRLFERFNIEVLATTDAATDTLAHHQAIKASDWSARIVPTFRPDAVVNIDTENWAQNIKALSDVSKIDVHDYKSFIAALEQRRAFFKSMGASATDHAAVTAFTGELSNAQADAIFQKALKGEFNSEDAALFTGHMLMQMARMSVEDGLTMQLHVGSLRNHNEVLFNAYGRDKGADIPLHTEFTRALKPLLNRYGSDPKLTLIVFTLDETTYSRELAPLAGHYPAMKLGAPWWFFDSLYGMERFLDSVVETAGIYNTAGFNDDTRAFPSIPARHDVWRRAAANWLAGLVVRHILDEDEAHEMSVDLAYRLAKQAYKLPVAETR